jgi:hypothetical protein
MRPPSPLVPEPSIEHEPHVTERESIPSDIQSNLFKIRLAFSVLYERINATLGRLNILLPTTLRNEIILQRAQEYLLSRRANSYFILEL